MKQIKLYIFFLWLQIFSAFVYGQKIRTVHVGDMVPNIRFDNMTNYNKLPLSMKQLKGKLVIIDFWTTGCPSCIEGIPRMEELQRKFGDKIQIFLINPWETTEEVKKRLSHRKNLRPGIGLSTLPIIVGDPKWKIYFPHVLVPHHVWISQKGTLLASTQNYNTNAENIQYEIEHSGIVLDEKKDILLSDPDFYKRPSFIPKNSGQNLLQYMVVTKYSTSFGGHARTFTDSALNAMIYSYLNWPIVELYKTAYGFPYFEKKRVVIQTNKISSKEPSNPQKAAHWDSTNMFSMEFSVPFNSRVDWKKIMKNGLNQAMNIEYEIEGHDTIINIPCYVIKRDTSIHLRTPPKDYVILDSTNSIGSVYSYLKLNWENIADSLCIEYEKETTDGKPTMIKLPTDFFSRVQISQMEYIRNWLNLNGYDILSKVMPVRILITRDKYEK